MANKQHRVSYKQSAPEMRGSVQCKAVTKKNKQCLRRTLNQDFCSIHSQTSKAQPKPTVHIQLSPERTKPKLPYKAAGSEKIPGWIYIYSYERNHKNVHIFNERTQKTERLTMSPFMMTLQRIFRGRQPMMLIKVGFTTATPEIRLSEWKQKCKHPISLLEPSKHRKARSFDKTMHGWPSSHAREAEKYIHQALKVKYGGGVLECHGCSINGQPGKHREWFYIPTSDLQSVMSLIDAAVRTC